MNDQTANMAKMVSVFTVADSRSEAPASGWPATGNKVVDTAMGTASKHKKPSPAPAAKRPTPAPEKRRAAAGNGASDWQEF